MTASAASALLSLFEEHKIAFWVDGGWGVDALLQRQTRPHNDLDIIVRVSDVPLLRETLEPEGFSLFEGAPPDSFVLAKEAGLELDVHAVVFDKAGNGVYRMQNGADWIYPAEGFDDEGTINGTPVRCLSPASQVFCHAHGYHPGENDFLDMECLRQRFGVELPPHLQARP